MTDTPDVTAPQSTQGDKAMKTLETLHYGPVSLRVVPELEMCFVVDDLYDLPFLLPEGITGFNNQTQRKVETKERCFDILHRSVFINFVTPGKERDIQRFFTWADQQEDALWLRSKKNADEAPSNNDSREAI